MPSSRRPADLVAVSLGLLGVAFATASRAQSGAEVIAQARAVAQGVTDKSMRVTMRMHGPGSPDMSRSLRGFEKRTSEGRRILWVFDAPAELAGTSFLAWDEATSPHAFWVYFPGQRRVRQVTDQMRRERFQGSSFTYEDLTAIFYFEYEGEHRLLGRRRCGERSCDVVETALRPGAFAYERVVSWLDAETHLPRRIEFFAADLVKVVRVLESADVEGIPTVLAMEASTPGDGYTTSLEYSDVHYNTGLADALFTIAHLSAGK